MGIGGISIWQLLIVLAIVLLLFGTKRLKGLGGDLGGAIKGFKKAVQDEDKKAEEGEKTHLTSDKTEQSTDNESVKNTEKEKV